MDYDKLIAEIEESAYVDYQGFKVVEFNEVKRIILDQKGREEDEIKQL